MLEDLFLLSRNYLETKFRKYRRLSLLNSCFEHDLSILIGQRGVGKTTLIVQYLLQYANNDTASNKIIYIPSDHFLLGNTPLYVVAEQFMQLGGEIIVFDEIHKYANWSKELKSAHDTFPKLKIIASGSSALEIHKGSHDLTRRAIVNTIRGLSLREYLELKLDITLPTFQLNEVLEQHNSLATTILEALKQNNNKILAEFNDYLQCGYYPYFLEFPNKNLYFQTLEQNFHTVIESDLMAIHPVLTGNSIRKIKQLLSFVASSVPFTPQWQKLKQLIEVGDERTLKTYFKYLEDAEIVRLVGGCSKKIHQLEMPEKVYLDNPNQFYAIAKNHENRGTIREIFFLNMLAHSHEVTTAKHGDFWVDEKMIFEVGGKNKDFAQVKTEPNAYLACDNIEIGIGKKIPLWLFGFLY